MAVTVNRMGDLMGENLISSPYLPSAAENDFGETFTSMGPSTLK